MSHSNAVVKVEHQLVDKRASARKMDSCLNVYNMLRL